MEVVVLLPRLHFPVQIYIISIGEKFIELILVGLVRPFDFSIQLWRPRSEIDMGHARVLHVPMEQRLELMAAVGADRMDSKREAGNNMGNELDSICLGMSPVDFQRSYTGSVVNGGILKPPDCLSFQVFED